VTWQLARRPEGVRADEVAEALGKSISTAYNVLASLCDEGVAERRPGGLYRLSAEFRETVAEAMRVGTYMRLSLLALDTSDAAAMQQAVGDREKITMKVATFDEKAHQEQLAAATALGTVVGGALRGQRRLDLGGGVAGEVEVHERVG
jgi:hypothetical protein